MKVLERKVLPFQEDDFFTPIRSKIDYARLLALSARLLLVNFDSTGLNPLASLKVVVDAMSRLFVYKYSKLYSVAFPFTVNLDPEGGIELSTFTGKSFDNQAISSVISVLDNPQFQLNPSPMEFFIGASGFDTLGLTILEEIFQFEPSYIRFDWDPERENGRLHPLYHLDVNYSGYGTYKLGVYNLMDTKLFEDLLDIGSDCSFIDINNIRSAQKK